MALEVADDQGHPVASVDSLVLRPMGEDRLAVGQLGVPDGLFEVEWARLPEVLPGVVPGDVSVVRVVSGVDAGAVRLAVHGVLAAVQSVVGRLVVVTRG
ncbi:hypothetical protein K1Y80_57015, partial [Streptomyces sp. MAG02]|nr:hypothetical protein [Streptomyces sp. MAG02]